MLRKISIFLFITLIFTACADKDNDSPIFSTSTTVTVAENQTKVMTVNAIDDSDVLYTLSDSEKEVFTIGQTSGVVTFITAPDYEIQNTYVFNPIAIDSKGNIGRQTVTVTISDVDENPPIFKNESSVNYLENTSGTVLTLLAEDDGNVTYRIAENDAESFNLNSVSGVITFARTPVYAVKSVYTFTATATDEVNNRSEQAITVNIIKSESSKVADAKYTRSTETGIVNDSNNNLMWQDLDVIQKSWTTPETYDEGNYSNTSGDTAATYCDKLTLGGYDNWRLPNINELDSIVSDDNTSPAIDTDIFTSTSSDIYWSSSTVTQDIRQAWSIDFDTGRTISKVKSDSHYIRCVRDSGN